MKIAFDAIPYTTWQGIESCLAGLLRHWPAEGPEVTVFANEKSAVFLSPLPPHIKLEVIPFRKLSRARLFWYEQFKLPRLSKKKSIDLLVCYSLFNPWLYQRKIVAIHDAAPFVIKEEVSRIGRIFWQMALAAAKKRSTKIITVSNFSKQELVGKLHLPAEKVEVVYNGSLELSKATPNETRYTLEKLSLLAAGENLPYFLAVGNARPRKNLKRLIEAFASIASHYPSLRLVIAGKNDARLQALASWVRNEKKIEGILFPGFVSEKEKSILIANSLALVFPSYYEGFGLPILEAEQLGAPVVCSDIPVFREIAGSSAIFFDPENSSSLANALELIVTNPEERERLKILGTKNYRRFSWVESAQHLKNIIEGL